MHSHMDYSWGWTTAVFLVLSGIFTWVIRSRLRTKHPAAFRALGLSIGGWQGGANWEFTKWLFTFRYFSLSDKTLTLLCLTTKFIWLATVYFLFAAPIYFEYSTTS